MKRLILVLALFATRPLIAQPPAACSAPQQRQFDFWIGEWDVTDARGQRVGTNRIERIVGGCALAESWEGTSGSRGRSLSAWDPGDNKWHQTWVDNEGTVLVISGGIINGEMVMEGERQLADGTRQLERITWSPNADGTLRQRWQASRDRGMRWTVTFDGVYRRRGPSAAGESGRGGRNSGVKVSPGH